MIYPHRCPLCHEILADQNRTVCRECERKLSPIQEPYCKKCGRPISEETEFCRDCERLPRSFQEGRGLFPYDERMRKALLFCKYGGRREYTRLFGQLLIIYGRRELVRWKPDVLVPIPLHKSKQRQRGFNQAGLLAKSLGNAWGIPVSTEILVKWKHTKSQKKLNEQERRKNLKQAFRVEQHVEGLRVLLIDDVFTTGSTIDAAAAVLMEAGAETVFFFTLCIALQE